jgi:ubiquinone/menaquinone biosynthesis C-methylase UbiE
VSEAPSLYAGGELETFARAENWKRYLAAQIRPFLGRDVLEVGGGLGETALALATPAQHSWVLLEPDAELAARARERLQSPRSAPRADVRVATVESLREDESFDAAIYVDVLEHIAEDRAELARVVPHLRAGGHLIVLAPAHQWLYSPFDRAIGHCRRYSAPTLAALGPAGVRLVRLRYLDAIGLLASAANRVFLRQTMPTLSQVRFWDTWLVSSSRVVDPLIRYHLGKSVLAVWQRTGHGVTTASRAAP